MKNNRFSPVVFVALNATLEEMNNKKFFLIVLISALVAFLTGLFVGNKKSKNEPHQSSDN